MYKKIIAIILLLMSSVDLGWIINNTIISKPEPHVGILNIDSPTLEVRDRVKVFSTLITDPNDRAQIAIFNYEFAQRILSWNAHTQQVNDVYSLAGKTFFQNRLTDKYDGLAEEIVGLLTEILTNDNHVLSDDEKAAVSKYFMGIAWSLIQKG